MSQVDDLIDLSADGYIPKIPSANSEDVILLPEDVSVCRYTNQGKRISLDNDPFDCALRKTNLQNDPFEIVAQQVEDHRLADVHRCVEVQTGDLLGLDDEEILSCVQSDLEIYVAKSSSEVDAISSPACHNGSNSNQGEKQRNESGCASFTPNRTGCSKSSNVLSGPSVVNGDIRTQLLKLSVSGSPLGSLLRRNSKTSDDGIEKSNSFGSQFINGGEFNDSYDDINSIKPNWIDSETEQDSDLELLRIPMLQQIDDNSEKKFAEDIRRKKNENDLQIKSKQTAQENERNVSRKIDLQMIRDRVKRHKSGKSNPQDVDELISSMKQIVSECSDEDQRLEAIQLLENLSALFSKKSFTVKHKLTVESLDGLPQPMVRQGTFDLDRSNHSNICLNTEEQKPENPESDVNDNQEMLPCSESNELSSIIEQIGRVLGNQNINVLQANLHPTENATQNPTYIVVMGTSSTHPPATPIRQHTQILMNNSTSPEFQQLPRNRSHSLSLHDKSAKRKSVATPTSPSVFSTPTRPQTLKRRSTISYSPATSIQPVAQEVGCQSENTSKLSNIQRRQSVNTDRNNILPKAGSKNISNFGVESNAKGLKLKASEYNRRSVGPLKATIPVKKVLPIMATPSDLVTRRRATDSKLITSTPIINTASSVKSSPYKFNGGKSKFHSPSLSATPNMKATTKSSLSGLQRRRSLTDSKSSLLSTNISSSRTSESIRQFVRKSTLGISNKNAAPPQLQNKENACPK